MKKAFDLALTIFSVVALVVAAIEAENDAPGGGAAKKAQAIEKLLPILAPIVPDFLEPLLASLLPFVIDMAVKYANQSGFFGKPAIS